MKRKPLEVTFLNKPNPERIFRAWGEIECHSKGLKLVSLEIRPKDKQVRSA